MKVIVATEVWYTSKGQVVKAVVRNVDGQFLGATNQTQAFKADKPTKVVRPRVTITGR